MRTGDVEEFGRRLSRLADTLDRAAFCAVPMNVDEPIDAWPADVVDDLVDGPNPWQLADMPADQAVIRAARCVDLEAAAGRLSLTQVVELYDAIARFAGTWQGDWHTIVEGRF